MERSFLAVWVLDNFPSTGVADAVERPELSNSLRSLLSFSAEIWSFGPEEDWDLPFDE